MKHFQYLASLIICVLRLSKSLASSADVAKQVVHWCPPSSNLTSSDQEQHEKFLNALNGKRILFIGDSVTRFQYLTLASFLAKGMCPRNDTDDRSQEYESLYFSHGWDDFFKDSSAHLNTPLTVATCFCVYQETFRPEIRVITYKDAQDNLIPTHVVMNFGLWLMDTERTCGNTEGDICPLYKDTCEYLNGNHPYKLFWMTTTPYRSLSAVGDTIIHHHLHVPEYCDLNPNMVVHRRLILQALSEQLGYWENLYHDETHFVPDVYHAFNGVLVDKILGGDMSTG